MIKQPFCYAMPGIGLEKKAPVCFTSPFNKVFDLPEVGNSQVTVTDTLAHTIDSAYESLDIKRLTINHTNRYTHL